jgi:alpha-beta hydrolase superfamily lysophospholipase
MKKIAWYNEMTMWDEYSTFFPEEYRIQPGAEPREEYWSWRGHRIHLDEYRHGNTRTAAKVIMLHGVGGNGRILSFMAAPLFAAGFDVIAPDLPGYGLTEMAGKAFDYTTWVSLAGDLVNRELDRDGLPIVLFGLSAGGMLAYQVACDKPAVRAVAASCLLDFRIREVLEASATSPRMARIGMPVVQLLWKVVPGLTVPMKMVANTRALANNDALLNLLINDPLSAGSRVPLGLVASMSVNVPALEPEKFTDRPVLLVHPEDDRWVDVDLSRRFFDRLACPKKLVLLEGAGHLPCELPGIQQMRDALVAFISDGTEE